MYHDFHNDIKRDNYTVFIENATKAYYLNKDTTEYSYFKLHEMEKKEQMALALISSTVGVLREGAPSVKDAAKPVNNAETVNGESYNPPTSLNTAYFNKILASKGDVTHCPNYDNIRFLINYATTTVNGIPQTKESGIFMNKLGVFELALDNLVKYKSNFFNVITDEMNNEENEKKRIVSQYFLSIVTAIDVGFDVLYSSCIKATIDYEAKPPVVNAIRFECKDVHFLEEHLTIVHYFNSLASNGKLTKILDSHGVDALKDASNSFIQEKANVLDVAFTLITTNKFTDLLFLPIYAIRTVVYVVRFLTAAYNRILFSLSNSMEMVKKKTVKADEFERYSVEAKRKAAALDQASRKAAVEIERDVRTVKHDAIPASNVGSGMML